MGRLLKLSFIPRHGPKSRQSGDKALRCVLDPGYFLPARVPASRAAHQSWAINVRCGFSSPLGGAQVVSPERTCTQYGRFRDRDIIIRQSAASRRSPAVPPPPRNCRIKRGNLSLNRQETQTRGLRHAPRCGEVDAAKVESECGGERRQIRAVMR